MTEPDTMQIDILEFSVKCGDAEVRCRAYGERWQIQDNATGVMVGFDSYPEAQRRTAEMAEIKSRWQAAHHAAQEIVQEAHAWANALTAEQIAASDV